MTKRVISGLILVAILFAVVVLNLFFPFGMNLVIGAITAMMIYELAEVFHLEKNYSFLFPSMAFAFVMPLISDIFWLGACCGAYLLLLAIIMLVTYEMQEKIDFMRWTAAIGMVFFITMAMGTLVGIRNNAYGHGAFYIFIVIMASWVADAGAYFAGSFFGKHKLCPKLSPKKTVEGVFGGFFLNILAMLVYGTCYNWIFFGGSLSISYLSLVLIGLICTVISIIGDLTFSMIKRYFQIKDYGHIIPGHGGFLDRFDSVIFVAPFLYFFLQVLPIIKFF
ncbi:MAG: phosphatidate cytidylyltransferase [Oscillospiraceae bacterium]|nr:phosphatidate cytidylyltransferase [Oscillospiraceae bacterium]